MNVSEPHHVGCGAVQLARVQPSMARELFSVGFVSCWLEIDGASQRELVRSLEAALVSPSIPPEIVTALLNLAEFMEHNERPLPLDTRTLGALAEKCHAYAKVRLGLLISLFCSRYFSCKPGRMDL